MYPVFLAVALSSLKLFVPGWKLYKENQPKKASHLHSFYLQDLANINSRDYIHTQISMIIQITYYVYISYHFKMSLQNTHLYHSWTSLKLCIFPAILIMSTLFHYTTILEN